MIKKIQSVFMEIYSNEKKLRISWTWWLKRVRNSWQNFSANCRSMYQCKYSKQYPQQLEHCLAQIIVSLYTGLYLTATEDIWRPKNSYQRTDLMTSNH